MDEKVSAFANEKEVLLNDGQFYYVTLVKETVIKGKKLILIMLES
jgi:hypothetical protein